MSDEDIIEAGRDALCDLVIDPRIDLPTRAMIQMGIDAIDRAVADVERLSAQVEAAAYLLDDIDPGEPWDYPVVDHDISMKRLFSRAARTEPSLDDSRELALAREVLRRSDEIERLRAQVSELLPWVETSPYAPTALLARIEAGEFGQAL